MATRLTSTNPAYAHLARTKAILSHTIALLQERFLGADSQDPQDVMYSDDLPRDDAAVPEQEILVFIQDLQGRRLDIERQLNCFDFVRRPEVLTPSARLPGVLNPPKIQDEQPAQPQAAPSRGVKRKKGRHTEG